MLAGIDHIILGIDDLDRGVSWVEQFTGVRAIFGGVHPGRGTRNALVALGANCYLEIMAPDPEQASPGWFTKILDLPEPKLVGWAVHTPDLPGLAQTAVAAGWPIDGPHNGSRARPGGKTISWKLFRLRDDRDGLLPLFLDWGESVHPAQDSPAGCELTRFRLQSPAPAELASVFQTLSVEVEIEAASKPRMLARVSTPRGVVDLTS